MSHEKVIQFFDWLFPHPSQGHREKFRIESEIVGDVFEIWVDFPEGHSLEKDPLPVLIYTDANLPTSRKLNPLVKEMREEGQLPPMILVGIAHQDSFLKKRNRDFIQGRRLVNGEWQSKSKNIGKARNFYAFLVQELIPDLQVRYAVSGNWSLMGHSLGGSAALYFMLQPDSPFRNYLAISPSVWLYRRNLLKIAKCFLNQGGEIQGNVFLSAGSLEAFNLILFSTKAYHRFLRKVQSNTVDLEGNDQMNAIMNVKMDVFPWRNHFTSVKPGIRNGLAWLAKLEAFTR